MTEKTEPTTEEIKDKRAAQRARAAEASRRAGQTAGSQFKQFLQFIREQGVVGLAVGLAIGLQATEFTKVIVSSLITPLIGLLVGDGGLRSLEWTLTVYGRTATFDIGILIDAFLKFVAVVLVIYFVVHGLKLDRLDKKKE